MNDSLLVYKLIILYLLDRSGQELTKAMICDFMLTGGYVSYFPLVRSLSELKTQGFLREEKMSNRTLIHLTDEGKETLSYFSGRLTADVRKDVDDYLKGSLSGIKQELSSMASYTRTPAGYRAELRTSERGQVIFQIGLTVPDEETAEYICAGWENSSADIYEYITDVLMKRTT